MLGVNSLLNQRYRLDKKIGQGGFAQVFLSTDQLLKREVAIKVLSSELITEDESFLSRFEKEAQSIASLNHPNVLGVFDYGLEEGTPYLVMPLVTGGTLMDKLKREKRINLQQAGIYLQQAAVALDYAHRRNIVHRDVKPQNMLLEPENDHLFLADFGIAKVLGASSSNTGTGVVGTLGYMSPEQLNGQVGLSTDIYALGCVLFQILTGQLPYFGPTETIITGHLMGQIPSVAQRSQGEVPQALQIVFDRALSKRPEDRFQTAGDLARAYMSFVSGSSGVFLPPLFNSPQQRPSQQFPIQTPNSPQQYPSQQFPTQISNSPQQRPSQQFPAQLPNTQQLNPSQQAPFQQTPTAGGYGSFGGPPTTGQSMADAFNAPSVLQTPPGAVKYTTQSGKKPKSSNSKILVIGLIAALVVAGIAALVFVLVLSNPPKKEFSAAILKDANDTFFVSADLDGGLAKFRELTTSFPNNATVWRDYGNALTFWKREGDGIQALQKATQLDPKDSVSYFYLANALLENYRYDEALQAAKTIEQLDPNGWRGKAALATIYSRSFKFDEAKPAFEAMQKAAGNAQNDPFYNWEVANYYNHLAKISYPNFSQNFKLAYQALDKILELYPTFPQVLAFRGFLFAASDYQFAGEKGIKQIQQAMDKQPQSARILGFLAYISRFKANDVTGAEKYARDALKYNEADPEANLAMGGVSGALKSYDSAFKRYERCIQVNPYQDQCFNDWAYYLGDNAFEIELAGQKDAARELRIQGLEKARKAVSFTPTHMAYYFRVGYFQYYLGNYKDAITVLTQTLAASPENIDNYSYLGLSYLGDGQKAKAQEIYDKGIKIDPNNYFIKLLGDQLKSK